MDSGSRLQKKEDNKAKGLKESAKTEKEKEDNDALYKFAVMVIFLFKINKVIGTGCIYS